MRGGCGVIRDQLPGVLDGDLESEVGGHVETCLRCQAEVVQYRKIGRALRSLEPQMALVPLGLHNAIMSALAEAQGRTASMWKGAVIGGAGLIVAAGTTAGILFSRHRHRAAV